MVMFSKRASIGCRPHWLTVATCAVGLVMAPYVVMAGTGSTTAPAPSTTPNTTTSTLAAADVQALNSSLTVEKLLVQFYNQNSNKSYLTGSTPVVNPTSGGTTSSNTTTNGTTDNTTTNTTTNGTTTNGTTTNTTTNGTTTDTTTNSTTSSSTTSTTTGGTAPAQENPPTTSGSTTSGSTASRDALRAMVAEFQNHHQVHVSLLQVGLGTNAQPAATFQNSSLDAASLDQFLTMAITLEDFAVSVHQQTILTGFTSQSSPAGGGTTSSSTTSGGTTTSTTSSNTTTSTTSSGSTTGSTGSTTVTPVPMNQNAVSTLLGIALDDARHAGALRAFRRTVSTAEGGNPNQAITDDGALNVPRTQEQITQFLQPYLSSGTTTNGTTSSNTTNGTTDNTTTNNTTTNNTTTNNTTTNNTTTDNTTTNSTTSSNTTTGTTAGV